MPEITSLTVSEFLNRAPQFVESIPDILRNPSANPLQATILLGVVIVVVLIVLLSVVLLIMRPSAEDEELLWEEDGGTQGSTALAQGESSQGMPWFWVASLVILTGVAVLVVTGIATSTSDVCSSCHANTTHVAARAEDPHAEVSCVSCHENGGPLARVTVNVATRAQHILLGRLNPKHVAEYGVPAASDGCARCHRSEIEGVSQNPKSGVRVSHKEPLAAGAECVDCHALSSGTVSSVTVGMAPCLRCHDGKIAKAECSVCHARDPEAAIRPVSTMGDMATALVPNPACDGCHFDMTECDACHGIRMPHSTVFQAYGHARPAAIDIWNNGSAGGARTCVKCHYAGHNSCQAPGCHGIGRFPSHASPSWRRDHGYTPWSASETACSCHQWREWDHDGMNYCEICHPVRPRNARP